MDRATWDQLPEKAQWDIKVALRGPDSYFGETLKWFTTAVIRGKCRGAFRVGGTVNNDLNLVILPKHVMGSSIHQRLGKFTWNAEHFVDHVRVAANWLNIPVLKISEDLWYKVMQYDYSALAAKEILEKMKTGTREPEPSETVPDQQTAMPVEAKLWWTGPGNAESLAYPPTKSEQKYKAELEELERHYIKHLGGRL